MLLQQKNSINKGISAMEHVNLDHLYSSTSRKAQPSAIREICKLIDKPDMKSLAGGWPDPAVFPGAEIASLVSDIMDQNAGHALQYGTTEGLLKLRRELCRVANEKYNIRCNTDQMLITHGSAQGMDLFCRVMLDPGDAVIVGLPSYFGAFGAVKAARGQVIGVPVDHDGMNTASLRTELEEAAKQGIRVKGIYVIPNFQNPSGATLSMKRRKEIIRIADSYDLIIIEDDPYGDLQFDGKALPPLVSMDNSGRVIHLRSFSKTFSPGMRLGYVIGQKKIVRQMVVAKQFVDCATNTLSQYILLGFIQNGLLEKRIRSNIDHYKKKRDHMLKALKTHFPSKVKWNKPSGGFFIFIHCPENIDATELLQEAVKHNVAFVAGQPFFADGSGKNTFRLSFSQASFRDIESAIEKLGLLIKEKLSK